MRCSSWQLVARSCQELNSYGHRTLQADTARKQSKHVNSSLTGVTAVLCDCRCKARAGLSSADRCCSSSETLNGADRCFEDPAACTTQTSDACLSDTMNRSLLLCHTYDVTPSFHLINDSRNRLFITLPHHRHVEPADVAVEPMRCRDSQCQGSSKCIAKRCLDRLIHMIHIQADSNSSSL